MSTTHRQSKRIHQEWLIQTSSVVYMFVLLMCLAACGGNAATPFTVLNNDPLASQHIASLTITPPEGWSLTPDGGGITDGNFIVTLTTLSNVPVDPQTTLEGFNGKRYDGAIVIERQSQTRLVAWFLLNDETLTSLHMNSRTPVTFSQQHDDILVEMARSVK